MLFTDEKEDVGLLRYMAEATVAEANLDDAAKKETLEAKYRGIADMQRAATARDVCFRKAIVEYFGEAAPRHRRTLAVRIADSLFSRSVALKRTPLCCDRCDGVEVENVIEWAVQVFLQSR
ncbi:MAG TPA: RecQ family zinc-binding domain-containing protein [Gemmatimonadaceae bacterium]|nr:RecQ family zinc-binding domain-containing protein [Gemmatimonadaceae bacterium]